MNDMGIKISIYIKSQSPLMTAENSFKSNYFRIWRVVIRWTEICFLRKWFKNFDLCKRQISLYFNVICMNTNTSLLTSQKHRKQIDITILMHHWTLLTSSVILVCRGTISSNTLHWSFIWFMRNTPKSNNYASPTMSSIATAESSNTVTQK